MAIMFNDVGEWFLDKKEIIKEELLIARKHPPQNVDILIVCHNQLEYIEQCIVSVRKYTENYNIYVWDNASNEETATWLRLQKDINLTRSETNMGFIVPNNRLAEKSNSPYLILLNSDTFIQHHLWSRTLTNLLIEKPEIGVTGYRGGFLSENMTGTEFGFGNKIDYIEGWCLCIARDTFNKFGLFDEQNLWFAYGEDSDLCLRLKESGLSSYASHLGLVAHHAHKTIKAVSEHCLDTLEASFEHNHNYLKSRWSKFLNFC